MLRAGKSGKWRRGRNGACYIMTSSLSFFLVLIQSERLRARTDWTEMQIHSESRVLIRMKKRHPCSSSTDLCLKQGRCDCVHRKRTKTERMITA